ncbi:MAG TPA: hypothetical protein VGS12_05865 [Caulobacteraceae bacterium]|nr:hypothetical protein [Caulobacteraceae bacterium]
MWAHVNGMTGFGAVLLRARDSLRPQTPESPIDPLRAAVRNLDARLRRAQGVIEYARDDACLLRISRIGAPAQVRLPSGAVIAKGEAVIALHFWNEHLPRARRRGGGFAWARVFRRQMVRSLVELARRFESDPGLAEVKAVRARLRLRLAGEARSSPRKVGSRMGFERAVENARAPARPAHDFLENFWLLALAWTYNRACARRAPLLRACDDLWMTRATLIQRYGGGAAARPDRDRS